MPGRAVLVVPAASAADPVVPDVPELSDAVDAPASVSEDPRQDTTDLGVLVNARQATSVEAVPSRALTAYQRAETVMRQADPSCHLTWQLIAAIGQVESNHGRFGGGLMTADGVVHPAILGPRLTGHGATSHIGDTDAGLLDGDQRFDRAVGPMQFIPSTWNVVGVDADGDGRRDPQDIDDASLATAVYLCSGTDDLATRAGQRAAVHRYNHSKAYVDLVIGIMAGYLNADPILFRLLGGTGVLDPHAYPYPTGGGPGPTPEDPQPTFEVVHPTSNPTGGPTAEPTAGPTGEPTTKPTATVTEKPTPVPSATPTSAAPTPAAPTSSAVPTDIPTSSAPTPTETVPTDSGTPTATATADPTDGPTDGPTDPGHGSDEIPQAVLDAYADCVTAGVDPADLLGMSDCLVELTVLAADDPVLVAVLATPPVTPPTQTQTQQQPRARRRR